MYDNSEIIRRHLEEDLAEAEEDVQQGRIYDADVAFDAIEEAIKNGKI